MYFLVFSPILLDRGIDDLREGIIRTPLPPMVTFLDDPLRLMRAVRFAARFGFTLHEVTWQLTPPCDHTKYGC